MTNSKEKKLYQFLINEIKKITSKKTITLMEVCGTHTVSIFRSGIKSLLPKNIRLISGPGCPVCVTSNEEIDKIIYLSKDTKNIIATFGDLMKVPGSYSSLEKEKTKGADIRIIYSPEEVIKLAKENKNKKIILIGIGFETTAPSMAYVVKEAYKKKINNFYFLSFHKIVPPALNVLVNSKDLKVDGFILPGHVSAIIGEKPYEFLVKKYKIPSCICGFEPMDILMGIYMLLKDIKNKPQKVLNEYINVVRKEGNKKALKLINEVFVKCDSNWRGIGVISKSRLKLRKKYEKLDAEKNFDIKIKKANENKNCICGKVLQGKAIPTECKLFAKTCNPENPIGPF